MLTHARAHGHVSTLIQRAGEREQSQSYGVAKKKYTMYTRAADSFKLAPRSGIAALLLEGGRTAHSRFRLPVPLPLDGATCHVKPGSVAANLLRDARLIVWDEAPMAPREALEAVDALLFE